MGPRTHGTGHIIPNHGIWVTNSSSISIT